MTLPFTPEQFFQVLSRYNEAMWPAQLVLTLLGVAAYAIALRGGEGAGRVVAGILALLWAWTAVAYHFAWFAAINAAAVAFGLLFLAQAAVFLWTGVVRGRLRIERPAGLRALIGHALVVYTFIVYPALSLRLGHLYPAAPTFGLPCPTTLFTIGLLAFAAPPLPRHVVVIPVLWALIASQAAWLFGIYQDLALIAAGAVAVWLALDLGQKRHHAPHPQ